ncbi:hypothetical protein BDV38DRAFT_244258 [Aspergillus pseudotamarii]|uniref:Uncharacterized protein n=1 Tax=Aspergillus pseudotamarii TaxID=132259 RepID=A0A5N6SVM0_ASPPS|nr:uncharacterized protein BDV38DRAFT_244258 [Aspergillus pseudotamarii]KAE8138672.1 hypothetical protein BDV38DRAFT_244258 [Aspergillus pseudotamarii]
MPEGNEVFLFLTVNIAVRLSLASFITLYTYLRSCGETMVKGMPCRLESLIALVSPTVKNI